MTEPDSGGNYTCVKEGMAIVAIDNVEFLKMNSFFHTPNARTGNLKRFSPHRKHWLLWKPSTIKSNQKI